MVKLLIGSVILAAMWQNAATDGARNALRACIKQAAAEAKSQKLGVDAVSALMHQKCAAQEASFKSAMWAFDSKNKVSRTQSEADAELQIEDLVTVAAERYAMDSSPQ